MTGFMLMTGFNRSVPGNHQLVWADEGVAAERRQEDAKTRTGIFMGTPSYERRSGWDCESSLLPHYKSVKTARLAEGQGPDCPQPLREWTQGQPKRQGLEVRRMRSEEHTSELQS